MVIRESAEDYLEAVLIIQERKGAARSIDIANELKITKPSVSVAMKNLREAGYLTMDDKGIISLLPPGLEIAEKTYERHVLFRDALIYLGVDPETATEDACKIEHAVSDQTFEIIKRHASTVRDRRKNTEENV